MKKIILFTALILMTLSVMGQNEYRYEMTFRGGFNVGGTYGGVDNITISKIVEYSNALAVIDSDGDTLDVYTPIASRVNLSDVAPLLGDTILVFAQTFGVGMAGDTVLFSYGDVLPLGRWGGTHSLVITGVNAVVYGTTPDIDIALLFDANFRDGTPTEVFSSDLTVTSTTTGNNATINTSNDTITDGIFLWLRVDQCAAQPTQCLISVYGYLE